MNENNIERSPVFKLGDAVNINYASAPELEKSMVLKLGNPPYVFVCDVPLPPQVTHVIPKDAHAAFEACLIGSSNATPEEKKSWRSIDFSDPTKAFPAKTAVVQKKRLFYAPKQ